MIKLSKKSHAICSVVALLFTAAPVDAFYNASQGRWLSRDPIGESGGRNIYGFVRSRPLNSTDYLGMLEVQYIGPGFQYVQGPPEFFWLGLQARLTPEEVGQVGSRGILLTRVTIDASVSECCKGCNRETSSAMFYMDRFSLVNGSLTTGDSVNPMTDGTASITFQPANFSSATLLGPCPGGSAVTRGDLAVSWDFKLMPYNEQLWMGGGFNPPAPGGYPQVFWPEAAHKPFSETQPYEWAHFSFSDGSYSMTFTWNNCLGYLPNFSSSPTLNSGPQRPGRGVSPGATIYR